MSFFFKYFIRLLLCILCGASCIQVHVNELLLLYVVIVHRFKTRDKDALILFEDFMLKVCGKIKIYIQPPCMFQFKMSRFVFFNVHCLFGHVDEGCQEFQWKLWNIWENFFFYILLSCSCLYIVHKVCLILYLFP